MLGRIFLGFGTTLLFFALLGKGILVANFGPLAPTAVGLFSMALLSAYFVTMRFTQDNRNVKNKRLRSPKSNIRWIVFGTICIVTALLLFLLERNFTFRFWPISYGPNDDFVIAGLIVGIICIVYVVRKNREKPDQS